MVFDGPDKWADGWISHVDVPVAESRRKRGGSVMIWAEVVDQTIVGSFKSMKKEN